MTEIGEVTFIDKEECDVEWRMDFRSLSEEAGAHYSSPDFFFKDESWQLVIWPTVKEGNEKFIVLRLCRRTSNGLPIKVKFSFSFKTLNGKKDFERYGIRIFEGGYYHDRHMTSKSDFEKRHSEFVDSGYLTVLCTLKRITSTGSETECSHCNETFDAEEITFHAKKCLVKCPECFEVVVLKKWQDHECQLSRTEVAVEKLTDDLKEIMMSGDHSDTTIKVKGEEFRLHRSILGARNSYFNSMFNSNMRESNTGTVCIDDCEPDVFRSFIHFLYTGKVDKLSPENICDLYEISDKYQEDLLKDECLRFMINSLSLESFTNFIIVALRHNEQELLEKATNFFVCNTKDIICDVKWLNFLKEYPVYANELHIKSLAVHQSTS